MNKFEKNILNYNFNFKAIKFIYKSIIIKK